MNASISFLRTLFLSGLVVTASSVFAQAAPNTKVSAATAGSYVVEPNHTQILFDVLHMGFTKYFGNFSGASGTLTFDPKKPSSDMLSISVPVSSVKTTSAKLDEELASADWIDAGQFPDISFKSTKVSAVGSKFTVVGDLTLHGVTKPVTLTATFIGSGPNMMTKKYTIGFEATGKIKRSDFGVSKYLPLIGDEVDLTLSGAFEKQD
jgi:polyisoprenoid-binding protein YceI